MGLGYAPQRNQLLRRARLRYALAIANLNAVISDPIEARSDETLLSVLLFSLYQKMIALVKLRGKEILHNPVSLKLFLGVRAQMIVNQTSKCEPIQPLSVNTGDWINLPPSENENAANRMTAMAI
ncbi:hypothetical protein MMC08_004807 [Hypocenomyce scalaris]|nr:hypothetical protein [Hypocenomyce scalaris]